jgi:hypothetical protein
MFVLPSHSLGFASEEPN